MADLEALSSQDIRLFRTELDMTRAELASRLGAGVRTVEDWEAGRRTAPVMLRLALAALAREVPPWQPAPALTPEASVEDAERAVSVILARLGDERASRFTDRYQDLVRAEATPAERVLCGHLIGFEDGYNAADLCEAWSSWPQKGWRTSYVFWPTMHGVTPTVGIECRHEDKVRELAIFVDQRRPGERLPEKLRIETALVARGVRVLSFSAADVLTDGERCKRTIEVVVSEMVDEVLYEDGQIAKPWKRPEHR